jgi:hypothetical protein
VLFALGSAAATRSPALPCHFIRRPSSQHLYSHTKPCQDRTTTKDVTPCDLQPFLLAAEEVSSFVVSVAARIVDSTNGNIPPPQV